MRKLFLLVVLAMLWQPTVWAFEQTTSSNEFTLTINSNDSSFGTITKNPDKQTYNNGEVVTITAAPNWNDYSVSWGNVDTMNGNTATVIMNENKIIDANFILNSDNQETLNPSFYNFRIRKDNPSKIYFDVKEGVTAADIPSYELLDNVENLSIESGLDFNNHWFILKNNKEFKWYHNVLIKFGSDNSVDFDLHYVGNEIPVPTPIKSVDVSDNTQLLDALKNVTPGTKININFNNPNPFKITKSGTVGNPIIIEGYNNTENGENYYRIGENYEIVNNDTLRLIPNDLSDKMPTISGTSSSSGTGVLLAKDIENCIIKNLNIRNINHAIDMNSYDSEHIRNIIFENINIKDCGDSNDDGKGFALVYDNFKVQNIRILNTNIISCSQENLALQGDNNLIKGVKSYTSRIGGTGIETDYNIGIFGGSNNVVVGSEVHGLKNGGGHPSHGFTLKFRGKDTDTNQPYPEVNHNLFENNLAINVGEAYQFRNQNCYSNVIKNNIAHAKVSYRNTVANGKKPHSIGVSIFSGAHNNYFKNNYLYNLDAAIMYEEEHEDGFNNGKLSENNNIINNIFSNIKNEILVFNMMFDGEIDRDKIYNNVFEGIIVNNYNETYFGMKLQSGELTFNKAYFYNNIVLTIANKRHETNHDVNFEFKNNNFFNTPWASDFVGNDGNLSEDPQFISDTGGDFRVQNNALVAGVNLPEVKYDRVGNKRAATPTIGAYEFGSSTKLAKEEPIILGKEFVLYPNPSQGLLTIGLTNTKSKEAFEIVLYSINGRLVYSNTIENNTTKTLNVSHLAKGIYVLKASSSSKSFTQKVLLH